MPQRIAASLAALSAGVTAAEHGENVKRCELTL